ncbi:DUF1772 domain-containing protein [Actinopolymorpha alba]|uniref:anthrone oxygenase family protein n=1 Tax=Actinopolymorpha alba TaxID=533267 RepID=UPI0003741FDB|nr:anthrone oxygenase family protein [Actinopolymorpha alba]
MLELARMAALVAATITMGLSAGLFYAYACSVMLGLAQADDRAFVTVMRRINVAIINGWFFASFLGALVFTALAAVLHLASAGRPALPWIVAALVLYGVGVLGVTARVNVPLNNELEAAGDTDTDSDAGLAAARAGFEGTWVRWNVVRAVAATAGFGCLVGALVARG